MIYYSHSNHKHVGHAFRSKFGGEALCGRTRAHYQDGLVRRAPARMCQACGRAAAAEAELVAEVKLVRAAQREDENREAAAIQGRPLALMERYTMDLGGH